MGGYPDLNRKLTVPHTVVLPIELYPPLVNKIYLYYVGVIRTLIGKYQKFMTCRLVYNIFFFYIVCIRDTIPSKQSSDKS